MYSSRAPSLDFANAMPLFDYSAADRSGARLRGTREANDAASARAALKAEGLFVIQIREGSALQNGARGLGRRISQHHLLDATRALGALLAAGLPLTRALSATARLAPPPLEQVLTIVRGELERGQSLTTALAAHTEVFPSHYVGLVRAGERGGDLAAAFTRLTEQLERDARLRSRLLSAALYPLILAVAGGGALVVLTVVVLPRFAELLSDAGTTLPPTTSAVLTVSRVAREHGALLLFGIALLIGMCAATLRHPVGRMHFARFANRLPIIGTLLRELAAARFARITGTLLTGGATLLPSMDDAIASLTAPLTAAAAARARTRVRDGGPLHLALRDEAIIPPLLSQLVQLGEESGRLGEFLLRSADLFEERSERMLQRLITLAEPLMIVVFGGMVGFVALALLQAIYSVNAGTFQ